MAAAFICLGLVVGFWRLFVYQSEVDKAMRNALVKLFWAKNDRFVSNHRARLLRLCQTRAAAEPLKADLTSLRRGELISRGRKLNSGPDFACALTRARPVAGGRKEFGEGIAHLQEAVKADPDNARINSDLGDATSNTAAACRCRPRRSRG